MTLPQTSRRAASLLFWSGVIAVTAGVLLHLPMFIDCADMNYMMAGMEMDAGMYVGMVLIVLGTFAAGFGLLPPKRDAVPTPIQSGTGPGNGIGGEGRLTGAHWRLMLTLTFALIIDTMKPASLGFVVPGMVREYGITRPTAAILVFGAITGTTLGSLIWGALADAMGRRAAILLAAIMFIGTSICGAMPSFMGNIIMCFLMGMSAGGMLPITYTFLAEVVPARHRGWFLVLLGGFGLIAGYLAASVCAALLEPVFGWRILWFIGLPTGVILVGLSRFIPESPRFLAAQGRGAEAEAVMRRFDIPFPPAPPVSAAPAPLGFLKGPLAGTTLGLNLAAFAWGMVNFGLVLWLPSDLRARGYNVAGSDVLLAQSALLALPTSIITAALYARWSTRGTLILMCLLTACGLAGFALPIKDPLLIIAVLMIGANGIIAVLLPYSAESYPLRIRGRGTGFVAGSSKFGGIVVQLVTMAAAVPPLATAAIVLALPVLASAAVVGRFGRETKGRRLDEVG